MRSRLLWFSLAVAAVLALGCGGDDSSAGGDGSPGDRDGAADGDGAPPPPPDTPLADRMSVTTAMVPSGVASGVSNWRVWRSSSLDIAPVFTVPLENCETLVGYTGQDGTARAARLAADGTLVETHTLAASRELRGLAAEPDGHFGALLWDNAADKIYLQRYTPAGASDWTEELTNPSNVPDNFNIGESRLEFGGGTYGAYYHVHGTAGIYDGHEGDTLKWVTSAGAETTGWLWGCSHSMSALLRYNDQDDKFMPACVTDCFPGTSPDTSPDPLAATSIGGIYLNHNTKAMDVNGACNGKVAAELGGAAIAPSGWAMVFNAHQNAASLGQSSYNETTMNQDIGFMAIDSAYGAASPVWLTSTSGTDEADSTVARWTPSGDSAEQYLVGWAEPGATYSYKLARISAAGSTLEGPVDISGTAGWGRRADPMRRHGDGDVVWAWFDSAGSTTLNLARVDAGQSETCASF